MRDVDVVFLDNPTDLARDNDDPAAARLMATCSYLPWEAAPSRGSGQPHMIFGDVRGVCSPADANPGEPVPTRVTAADHRSQTGFRVLGVWSWAGRTAARERG